MEYRIDKDTGGWMALNELPGSSINPLLFHSYHTVSIIVDSTDRVIFEHCSDKKGPFGCLISMSCIRLMGLLLGDVR